VLAPYGQHVPLDQYKENLRTILEHPLTKAQSPKIIIITPGPINEYQLQYFDASKGFNTPSRTANNTKIYADACRDVARSLGLPVADLWTAFMNYAGWKDGQPLVGSRDAPANELLSTLLTDGASFLPSSTSSAINLAWHNRVAFHRHWIQDHVRRSHEGAASQLARGRPRKTADGFSTLGGGS
jgi:hypothetical protein